MQLPRRNFIVLNVLLVLLLSACASTVHQELAAGKKEFLQKKYNLSYVHIKKAAQAGDPDAQYALGYMYYYGQGAPQDLNQSKYWIHKAAASGQSLAIRALQKLGEGKIPVRKTVFIKKKAVRKKHVLKKHVLLKVKHRSKLKKQSRYSKTEMFLLQQPRHFYTIQLLGSYSKGDVIRFINKYHFMKGMRCYRTHRNGKVWYVVIYGTYPTLKAAALGLRKLPASVRKNRPWVKSILRVQKEIKS